MAANRPVFIIQDTYPWYKQIDVSFTWTSGFFLEQKQKNIQALHKAFLERYSEFRVLEVSTKSPRPVGAQICAANLTANFPEGSYPIERLFQSAMFFEHKGPFPDLIDKDPKAAASDERMKDTGHLIGYSLFGTEYPALPKTIFFDWLYFKGLLDHPDEISTLYRFDAFTDIEYIPDRSLTCQPKASAMFSSLARANLLDRCRDFASFYNLMTDGGRLEEAHIAHPVIVPPTPEGQEEGEEGEEAPKVPRLPKEPLPDREEILKEVQVGMTMVHKSFGTGTVVNVTPTKGGLYVFLTFGDDPKKKKFLWPAAKKSGFLTIPQDA